MSINTIGNNIYSIASNDSVWLLPNYAYANINWKSIFLDHIGIEYPEYINWDACIDQQWNFSTDDFILSRSSLYKKRNKYIQDIGGQIDVLDTCIWANIPLDKKKEISIRITDEIVSIMWRMQLWYWEHNIHVQDIANEIAGAYDQRSIDSWIHMQSDIEQWLKKEQQEWESKFQTIKLGYQQNIWKYIADTGALNIQNIILDLDHWTPDHESMLMAFYTATCSPDDLQVLQQKVQKILDSNIKKLNTIKVFLILERVLPYIYEWFQFDFQVPEIFNPMYLQHIAVRNLTLEDFTQQVGQKWEELWWSADIQNKLIQQYTKFGESNFGQWSDQLRYRQQLTSKINIKNYIIPAEQISLNKRPKPSILQPSSGSTEQELMQIFV